MREIRTSGSEGGETESNRSSYPYHWNPRSSFLAGLDFHKRFLLCPG
jgi:hypothetical protein